MLFDFAGGHFQAVRENVPLYKVLTQKMEEMKKLNCYTMFLEGYG